MYENVVLTDRQYRLIVNSLRKRPNVMDARYDLKRGQVVENQRLIKALDQRGLIANGSPLSEQGRAVLHYMELNS